jgi:hypothetical protein
MEGQPRPRVIFHQKDGVVNKPLDLDLGYVSNFEKCMAWK